MSDPGPFWDLGLEMPSCFVTGLHIIQTISGPAERLQVEGLELPETPDKTTVAWSLSLATREEAPRLAVTAQMFAVTMSEVAVVEALASVAFADEARFDLDDLDSQDVAFREALTQTIHPLWDFSTQSMRAACAGAHVQHNIPRATVEPTIAWPSAAESPASS